MIDTFLKDFLSAKVRRKVYSAAALIQMFTAIAIMAFNDSGLALEEPLLIAGLSFMSGVITMLAKANVSDSAESEKG